MPKITFSASCRQVKFAPKYRILARFFLLTAYLGKLQKFGKNMAKMWQKSDKANFSKPCYTIDR